MNSVLLGTDWNITMNRYVLWMVGAAGLGILAGCGSEPPPGKAGAARGQRGHPRPKEVIGLRGLHRADRRREQGRYSRAGQRISDPRELQGRRRHDQGRRPAVRDRPPAVPGRPGPGQGQSRAVGGGKEIAGDSSRSLPQTGREGGRQPAGPRRVSRQTGGERRRPEGGPGPGGSGEAEPRLHPHHRPHFRQDRPHAADRGQPGQRRLDAN